MNTKKNQEKYSWMKHLDFIVIDLFALVISFFTAFILKFGSFSVFFTNNWSQMLAIICLLDLVLILFTGTFSGVIQRNGSEELVRSGMNAIYGFILCCIILYVFKLGVQYSRIVMVTTYSIQFLLTWCLRMGWKWVLRSGKLASLAPAAKTIFVVGRKTDMPQLLRSINSGFFKEYIVKGVYVVDAEPGERVSAQIDLLDSSGRVKETSIEFENVTALDSFADYVLENHISEVFISVDPTQIDRTVYETLIANGKGIHLNIAPMIGFATDDQSIATVGTYKTLSVGVYSFTGEQMLYLSVKRTMDILFGVFGLIAMLPIMLAVKISYLANGDTNSIFYTQTRVGIDGKTFKMFKFRSMVHNAEEVLKELLKDPRYKKEWDDNQKLEDDPRITKMGNILRKTSLDEIPQFLNVLRGDMSLIGPRPLVVGELEQHNGLQLYNQVKPGITGWWGCNGRSNTTYDERLELEYYYVKNCSLYLDVLCILKTVAALLKREGAK